MEKWPLTDVMAWVALTCLWQIEREPLDLALRQHQFAMGILALDSLED